MSDPSVESCPHQKESDSGKMRCTFPNRSYYFCKTNRRDNVCPVGLTTTYDDPEIKPQRPFESVLGHQIRRFHESHITSRWNLKNRLDAFQLYYQLDLIQFRSFELAMALQRVGKYKESHQAWAKHDAYNAVMHDLFPYRDASGKTLSDEYRKIQTKLAELESQQAGDQHE